MVLGFVGVLFAIIAVSTLNQPSGSDPARQASDPTDTQLVTQGQQIYAARCASCHGANLEGAPNWRTPLPDGSMPAPPHDVSGHTWHHNDQSLFETTKYGGQATMPVDRRNTMPAFGGSLSDAEIWAVLAYIKSTWPPEILARQQQGHE